MNASIEYQISLVERLIANLDAFFTPEGGEANLDEC